MLLGRQEVSWSLTAFRDMFGAVLLLISILLLCGQSLCVLWDLSNAVWGQVNCFYKAPLGQAVVQPCWNIRMFPPWVSAVVKRLPACEDKDSVNETVSTPTRTIALDDCLVSLLWSKSVFGDTLLCIVLIWEWKSHLLQPRSHVCSDVLLPLGSRFLQTEEASCLQLVSRSMLRRPAAGVQAPASFWVQSTIPDLCQPVCWWDTGLDRVSSPSRPCVQMEKLLQAGLSVAWVCLHEGWKCQNTGEGLILGGRHSAVCFSSCLKMSKCVSWNL